MKKIITLITCALASICLTQAQIPPQAFNYSAVARDAQSNPIANSTIGIQISILKTSTLGTSQYQENHFVNTDQFGLFNLIIGAGAVQSGSMAAIDWSADNYYLKVGMDANGGSNFLTMGTTQLLSVPYALHSKTADSLISSGSIPSNPANFSYEFPDGYDGDVLFLNNLLSTPYTVPGGRNLKILHVSNGYGALSIDSTGIDPKDAFVGEGRTLSVSNNNTIIHALLAPKTVDCVVIDFSSTYTVPAGKTLYCSRVKCCASNCFNPNCDYYLLNGTIEIGEYGDFGDFISIYPELTTIEYFPGTSGCVPKIVTGYLK